VVVAGTSGEFITMTGAERTRLVEIAAEAIGDRVPVIVGTGAASTRETAKLTAAAAISRGIRRTGHPALLHAPDP